MNRFLSKLQSNIFGLDPKIEDIGWDLEDDTLEIIRNSSKADYFSRQFAIFNGKYAVNFAEVQLFNQLGYSFNLMDADKLFKIDE